MLSMTRLLGLVCTFASCNLTFPPPIPPIEQPKNELIVQTNSGLVQGYYMSSMSGKLIGAFEGIPFAESPIGQRRFRNPVKKSPWNGTLLAHKPGPACIQMDPTQYYRVIGSEDCLFLNIYVPLNRAQRKDIPILFYIHGGGFYWGEGAHWGPTYLLDRDVIIITSNYRLGALGFLSTGPDKGSSGNFGLKDQALTLDWIYENIRSFGGDPKRITLGGQSAGAVSVHLHMMSPRSKDKIYGAISHSGSALSSWAIPPNQYYYFKRLARSVHCVSENSADAVECMRKTPARQLIARQYNLFEYMENPQILFGPNIESPTDPSAFITMKPKEYYQRGLVAEIPWITGVTKDEGDLFSLVNYLGPFATRGLLRNMEKALPSVLMYSPTETKRTKKIEEFYLSQFKKFSFGGHETLHYLSQMVGDRFFYVPFHKTVRTHSESINAPLYAYLFTYKGSHGIPEKFQLSPAQWGVLHNDDVQYLFNSSSLFAPMKKTDRDFRFAEKFIDSWVNFITRGSPSNPSDQNDISNAGSWEPFTRNNHKLFEINERSRMTDEPNESRIDFWKSIGFYP